MYIKQLNTKFVALGNSCKHSSDYTNISMEEMSYARQFGESRMDAKLVIFHS